MRRGARDGIAFVDRARAALRRSLGVEDTLRLRGHVLVEVFDGETGELKDSRESTNLILTAGRNMIADRLLASPSLGKPTHMGVGTSGTAPAAGDTTITGEDRNALTSKTRNTNVVTFVGDWAAGEATATLQEAGLWDAASGGVLVGRVTFGSIAKGANDTLKVTWTWTLGT
jgi:hypothetical protein